MHVLWPFLHCSVHNSEMDLHALSRELLRALRSQRSQTWLSRRVGLRSNLVYRWEAGRAWPSAQQFFRIVKVAKVPLAERLEQLLGSASNLRSVDLTQASGVQRLLSVLIGSRPIVEVAKATGKSRYVVSRWLSGITEIRLPDLLKVIQYTTLRLLDFVALITDPAHLPSISSEWARLEAARTAAYDAPWSHAVLRALELAADAAKDGVSEKWLSKRLNLPLEEVERCVALLLTSGQVRRRRSGLYLAQTDVVDTGTDRIKRRKLATFWASIACERLEQGTAGTHSYNLFTIAEKDLPRVYALHRQFFTDLRILVSESSKAEHVVLYAGQLLALDAVSTD